MNFLGLKAKHEARLVVVTHEGHGRLMLNGNRTHDDHAKRNAAAYGDTVCWIELAPGGGRLDQGLGPAAGRLEAGEAERMLRDLPRSTEFRNVLGRLEDGRENAGHWLRL